MTKVVLRRKGLSPASEIDEERRSPGESEDPVVAELQQIREHTGAIHSILRTWSIVVICIVLLGILIAIAQAVG